MDSWLRGDRPGRIPIPPRANRERRESRRPRRDGGDRTRQVLFWDRARGPVRPNAQCGFADDVARPDRLGKQRYRASCWLTTKYRSDVQEPPVRRLKRWRRARSRIGRREIAAYVGRDRTSARTAAWRG